MKRIIFCVAVGKPKFAQMAIALAQSLDILDDPHERVVMTDLEGFDWLRYFDKVVKPTQKRSALDKLFALEYTDADQVLSLDVDMLAFKRTDDIFEFCKGKPFAVQGYTGSEGIFHGMKVTDIMSRYGKEHSLLFNGGLAYYERSQIYENLLKTMVYANENYDSIGFERFRGNVSEEVCMLHAMMSEGYMEMIPVDLQFQNSAAGAIGKLHLNILKNEFYALARQEKTRVVRPYIFHAWRYKDFYCYWKAIRQLEAISKYEDLHGSGFLPRHRRWQRSLEQRWMKFRGFY